MRRTNTSFLALLIVLTTSQAVYSQTKILEPEKVIEQTIATGETHSYSMTLPAGMYGAIELNQKGLNQFLTIFSPSGQKLRTADLASVGFSEVISLIAQDATTYRIEVKAAAKPSRTGTYTLKLSQIHPATAEDRARVQGQTLAEEGMQFLIKQSATSKTEALDKFQKSIPVWQAAKDVDHEAQAFYYVAYTQNALGQYAEAAEAAMEGSPAGPVDRQPESRSFSTRRARQFFQQSW
ncbi:MAG: hypothetical protein V7638_4922 [Acidobacteriota bacterium]|jgi:hypothetical protein